MTEQEKVNNIVKELLVICMKVSPPDAIYCIELTKKKIIDLSEKLLEVK